MAMTASLAQAQHAPCDAAAEPPAPGAVAVASAQAPLRPRAADGWAVQLGASERSHTLTLALIWELPNRWFKDGSGWSTHLEASLAGWWPSAPAAGDPGHYTRIGITPVLRYRFAGSSAGAFVEAGIGAHLIGPVYRAGDRRFGSAFNFGDHLAVGWMPDARGRHELALRLQHFSNGGLRPPNPGENFLQLRWVSRF